MVNYDIVNYDIVAEDLCERLGLNEDLVYEFVLSLLPCIVLFDKKQHDYGSGNIAQFGDLGVLIRINDKVQRLKTLLMSGEEPKFSEEGLKDTWMDIAVYGVIGYMCHQGMWPDAYSAVEAMKARQPIPTGIIGESSGPSQ